MSHKIGFFVIFSVFPLFLLASTQEEVQQGSFIQDSLEQDSQTSVIEDDMGDDLDMLDGILDEGQEGDERQKKLQEMMRRFVELGGPLQNIENKFGQGDIGEPCLKSQEDIVHFLGELVEELRPRSQKPQDEDNQESEQEGGQQGSKPGQGQGPPNQQVSDQQPESGAQDSVFRSGTNKTGELRKFVDQKATSSWGKLPEKERKAMQQEMREKLPQGNSKWVEEFSKLLASGEAK